MLAISALTLTLTAICTQPSASDCASTLPCPGEMNCGSNDRYITAIFGFARFVTKPIVKSFRRLSCGS
ncbi:hypothetical protein WK58_27515 [Burkholderia ubonensis]|nr:hypothetical protein WK58_27515 [Burkholderia ubonensis]